MAAISTLATKFRESASKLKDYRMKQESEFGVQYPSGFLTFDFMNGALICVRSEDRNLDYYSIGINEGSIVMLIGRSGCGKSTWALQTAANIVRPFENGVIWADEIEAGSTETRKQKLTGFYGDEYKKRLICRNQGITAENLYLRIKAIHDTKMENHSDFEYDTGLYDPNGNRLIKLVPSVYIVDSIALLMPEKYTEEEEMSGSMSATAAAKSNSMLFKRLVPLLKASNIILLMINHITMSIDINPMQKKKSSLAYLKQGETLPGGLAIQYLTDILVRFDDNVKLKAEEGFGIFGSLVDLTLYKSRTGRAGNSTTLVFDQDNGFDPFLSMLQLLKDNKLLEGAGAYLRLPDSDIKFSQKKFKEMLFEDEEFQKQFITYVYDVLKKDIPVQGPSSEEECASKNKFNKNLMTMLNPNLN